MTDEQQEFYRKWDAADEDMREKFYPYLKDEQKTWLDEREEQ